MTFYAIIDVNSHVVFKEVISMIRELIDKLKIKKKQLQKHKSDNIVIKTKSIEEKQIDIKISKNNNIYKIKINDYISIGDYIKKMKSDEKYHILDFLCNCVLWNNKKQKINKGTYYVIIVENCIYNILFTDTKVEIDERTKIEIDEQNQKENITQERFITFDIEKNEYRYFSAKHDKTGNTYYTKYYNKNSLFSLGELDLTEEETYEEVNSVISNLETIDGITNILDIQLLKEHILKDLFINTTCEKKKIQIK